VLAFSWYAGGILKIHSWAVAFWKSIFEMSWRLHFQSYNLKLRLLTNFENRLNRGTAVFLFFYLWWFSFRIFYSCHSWNNFAHSWLLTIVHAIWSNYNFFYNEHLNNLNSFMFSFYSVSDYALSHSHSTLNLACLACSCPTCWLKIVSN
jgi:hypothetical protein